MQVCLIQNKIVSRSVIHRLLFAADGLFLRHNKNNIKWNQLCVRVCVCAEQIPLEHMKGAHNCYIYALWMNNTVF